jgi:hypothetical protein
MSRGFLVDLSALQQAAQGVNGILDAVGQQNVSDIKCDKSAIGHDNLAETVSGFCDRWNVGVGNLATDGREIAGRLSLSVNVYRSVEQGTRDHINGILQRSTGPDPAAQ